MAPLNFKVPATLTSPLDVARSYIAAGIAVFPCHEATVEEFDPATGEFIERSEKSPYTSNGLKGASTSDRIVKIWFGERHPNAAIGIPTGEPLGGWVLDLDRHADDDGTVRDGHDWLTEMEAKHGPLPDTARARTANNGTHIFFKYVPGLGNRAAIAPGVDTRSQGGYVVAPGSVMADGRRYEWVDHEGVPYTPISIPEFADAPEWLLALLEKPEPTPATTTTYTTEPRDLAPYVNTALETECRALATTSQGGRGAQLNTSAFSLGQLVASGVLARGDAESELYAAALACGLVGKDGDKRVRANIKRSLDAGMKSPRQIPERAANDNTPPVDVGPLVANGLKKKEAGAEAIPEAVSSSETDTSSGIAQGSPPVPRARERFEKTWFDNIEEGKPKETFIKGVFGLSEFTTVSGLPGTGKSVVATDMACHVAAGKEWHGRRVRQGLVVYVAAERKKLTERRMMAFRKKHGVADVPLLVIGGRLDFTRNLDDARALIAAIQEAELETGLSCIWVIIDTLTRVFGAGDQNASKDMVKFVQSCDEIIAETKAHVTAIHHTAWAGERMKGAIDLDGAVDASFMVKKDHGKYKLNCNGTNDGEEGDILTFIMESVVLGVDEDGEPTTAPVVVQAAEVKLKPSSVAAKDKSARAYELLLGLLASDGVDPESPGYPDGAMVVSVESWRQAVYDDCGDKMAPEAKRQRFNRCKKDLLADGIIGENPNWVWAIPPQEA